MDTAQSTLTTLRAAFETGCTLTYEARCRVLSALKVSVKQHRTQVEASLAQDLARCKFVTLLADYAGVLEYIDYSLSHLQSWMKRRPEGAHSYALHEALGVALVLGSWNFPFNTTLKPLICAISAGNCVCVKPSEIAVESSKVVASILRNMNEASVKCLEGDAAVAVALLQVRWDIIAFTGSPSKGRLVAAAAAQHLTPTVLELGGKCPVIIDEDADLDLASSRVAHGRFFNCGQLCLSPDVAFVHENVLEQFLDSTRRTLTQFYGENPQDSPDLGRIVNRMHFERVCGLLEHHGGQVVLGGQTNREERYISPTIVLNPNEDSALATEEIFGPVLVVTTFKDLKDCVKHLKALEKPLALYYFGAHHGKEYVLEHSSSGGFVWNDTIMHAAIPDLPFGGVGNSGRGLIHGEEGYWAFSHRKMVFECS